MAFSILSTFKIEKNTKLQVMMKTTYSAKARVCVNAAVLINVYIVSILPVIYKSDQL